MEGSGSDFGEAVASVRATPSLLVVGVASTAAWVGTLLALVPGKFLSEWVASTLLIASGTAEQGFSGPTAPKVTVDVLQVVVLLGVAVVVLEVLWTLFALPATAAATRVQRHDEELGEALRWVVDRPARLLAGGIAYRAGVVALSPLVVAGVVAVYLSLGTLLEAAGRALGGAALGHWLLGPVALLVALAVGRRGAAAAMGSPVVALVETDDRTSGAGTGGEGRPPGPIAIVGACARSALAAPRGTARDAALPGALVVLPLVAGIGGVALFAEFLRRASDATALAGFVALATILVALGATCHTLAGVLTIRGADPPVPATAGDAGSGVPGGLREAVPLGGVALAALVLTGAGLAGGFVRVADVGAGGPGPAPPGPVAGDARPDRIAERGIEALGRTSHRTTFRSESRRVYANGTAGNWTQTMRIAGRYDRRDREVLFASRLGTGDDVKVYVTYVDDTVLAAGYVDDESLPPSRAAVRGADLDPLPKHPGLLGDPARPFGQFLLLSPEDTSDWRVLDRADGRVRLVSRDPGAVAAFSSDVSPERLVNGSVRATVSAETGYVRRVDLRYRVNYSDTDYVVELRETYVVDGYRTTDVRRPPGLDRDPVEVLLDAVFY